jgi:hypothetical protein
MSCHVLSCLVVSRHVMSLCHAMSCHSTSRQSCRITRHSPTLNHTSYTTSHHITTPRHITSRHITSPHHVTSHHVTSHHHTVVPTHHHITTSSCHYAITLSHNCSFTRALFYVSLILYPLRRASVDCVRAAVFARLFCLSH